MRRNVFNGESDLEDSVNEEEAAYSESDEEEAEIRPRKSLLMQGYEMIETTRNVLPNFSLSDLTQLPEVVATAAIMPLAKKLADFTGIPQIETFAHVGIEGVSAYVNPLKFLTRKTVSLASSRFAKYAKRRLNAPDGTLSGDIIEIVSREATYQTAQYLTTPKQSNPSEEKAESSAKLSKYVGAKRKASSRLSKTGKWDPRKIKSQSNRELKTSFSVGGNRKIANNIKKIIRENKPIFLNNKSKISRPSLRTSGKINHRIKPILKLKSNSRNVKEDIDSIHTTLRSSLLKRKIPEKNIENKVTQVKFENPRKKLRFLANTKTSSGNIKLNVRKGSTKLALKKDTSTLHLKSGKILNNSRSVNIQSKIHGGTRNYKLSRIPRSRLNKEQVDFPIARSTRSKCTKLGVKTIGLNNSKYLRTRIDKTIMRPSQNEVKRLPPRSNSVQKQIKNLRQSNCDQTTHYSLQNPKNNSKFTAHSERMTRSRARLAKSSAPENQSASKSESTVLTNKDNYQEMKSKTYNNPLLNEEPVDFSTVMLTRSKRAKLGTQSIILSNSRKTMGTYLNKTIALSSQNEVKRPASQSNSIQKRIEDFKQLRCDQMAKLRSRNVKNNSEVAATSERLTRSQSRLAKSSTTENQSAPKSESEVLTNSVNSQEMKSNDMNVNETNNNSTAVNLNLVRKDVRDALKVKGRQKFEVKKNAKLNDTQPNTITHENKTLDQNQPSSNQPSSSLPTTTLYQPPAISANTLMMDAENLATERGGPGNKFYITNEATKLLAENRWGKDPSSWDQALFSQWEGEIFTALDKRRGGFEDASKVAANILLETKSLTVAPTLLQKYQSGESLTPENSLQLRSVEQQQIFATTNTLLVDQIFNNKGFTPLTSEDKHTIHDLVIKELEGPKHKSDERIVKGIAAFVKTHAPEEQWSETIDVDLYQAEQISRSLSQGEWNNTPSSEIRPLPREHQARTKFLEDAMTEIFGPRAPMLEGTLSGDKAALGTSYNPELMTPWEKSTTPQNVSVSSSLTSLPTSNNFSQERSTLTILDLEALPTTGAGTPALSTRNSNSTEFSIGDGSMAYLPSYLTPTSDSSSHLPIIPTTSVSTPTLSAPNNPQTEPLMVLHPSGIEIYDHPRSALERSSVSNDNLMTSQIINTTVSGLTEALENTHAQGIRFYMDTHQAFFNTLIGAYDRTVEDVKNDYNTTEIRVCGAVGAGVETGSALLGQIGVDGVTAAVVAEGTMATGGIGAPAAIAAGFATYTTGTKLVDDVSQDLGDLAQEGCHKVAELLRQTGIFKQTTQEPPKTSVEQSPSPKS